MIEDMKTYIHSICGETAELIIAVSSEGNLGIFVKPTDPEVLKTAYDYKKIDTMIDYFKVQYHLPTLRYEIADETHFILIGEL